MATDSDVKPSVRNKMNSAINLRSGLVFDFVKPMPDSIQIEDIAGALSKICRFGGHCQQFYSVAEHSYLCAYDALADDKPIKCVMAVLMHDATEAYVNDMVKPLKSLLPEYKRIERSTRTAIAEAFNIDFDLWGEQVNEIDFAMLIAEHKFLFDAKSVLQIEGSAEAREVKPAFECCHPAEAEANFLEAFHHIKKLLTKWR